MSAHPGHGIAYGYCGRCLAVPLPTRPTDLLLRVYVFGVAARSADRRCLKPELRQRRLQCPQRPSDIVFLNEAQVSDTEDFPRQLALPPPEYHVVVILHRVPQNAPLDAFRALDRRHSVGSEPFVLA